jgi:hypothetical protein
MLWDLQRYTGNVGARAGMPLGDTVQRLATENTTHKQRIRDLTASNRTLEERLQAARSNDRFLDKRIASLEVQLLSTATG